MKRLNTLLLILIFLSVNAIAQDIPSPEWQVKTAVLAAPEDMRDNATVLGYDEDGSLVTLRKGSNSLICLADDPSKSGFSVAAYHKELDDFMARGRELKSQGKGFKEIFDIREEEVKSGKLKMPEKTTLFVLSGKVNAETMEVEDTYLRYVIYIPYATSESTGLPLNPPGPGGPWIMDPGTHRAHIMISPPKN